jgi:hypothetical protein
VPGDAGKYDLVVTMEDATSEIYSMFLADEEGTASSLRGAWPRISHQVRPNPDHCRVPGRCRGAGSTRWPRWSRADCKWPFFGVRKLDTNRSYGDGCGRRAQPLAHRDPKAPGVILMLEAHDEVVGVPELDVQVDPLLVRDGSPPLLDSFPS